jgi:hypothetical protein
MARHGLGAKAGEGGPHSLSGAGRTSHRQARWGAVPLTGFSLSVAMARLRLAPSGPNGS